MKERRETEYDYARWLREGWYLWNWCEHSNTYTLRLCSEIPKLSIQEIRRSV